MRLLMLTSIPVVLSLLVVYLTRLIKQLGNGFYISKIWTGIDHSVHVILKNKLI